MAFGHNPYVAKAEQAEQKAREARDERAMAMAWRECANNWDRAAAREKDARRKQDYADKATEARAQAELPFEAPFETETSDKPGALEAPSDGDLKAELPGWAPKSVKATLLN